MSHGEATIDNPAVPLERAADAPPRSTSRIQHVRFRAVHVEHVIAPGVVYQAWAFDRVVPIPHSMDFHAPEIAPSRAYVNVMPKA